MAKARRSKKSEKSNDKREKAENDRNTEAQISDMSFKMPREFHREFKTGAIDAGISMKELLIRCFALWKKRRSSGRELTT